MTTPRRRTTRARSFRSSRAKRAYLNTTVVSAVELHWADLTNLQAGRLNATLASFRIIFESHHFVDAMLRRGSDWLAWFLRLILWFASWSMRGPIAALTIATAGYCIFLLFGPVIQPKDALAASPFDSVLGDANRRFVIVQFVLFLAAVIGLAWIVYNKGTDKIRDQVQVSDMDITWYDTAFWLMVVTAGMIILDYTGLLAGALAHVGSLDKNPVDTRPCFESSNFGACYIDGLYRLIIWGWRIYGGILLVALAALIARTLMPEDPSRRASLAPIAASIATVILQFMMWTTIVVTLLYAMLNRAEVNRDLLQSRPGILDILKKQAVDPDSAAFKLFQFPEEVQFQWIDRFKFVYAMTALTVLLSILVVVILVRRRRRLAACETEDLKALAEKMPRVLFSNYLIGTLIALFLALLILIYLQGQVDDSETFREVRKWFLPLAAIVALAVPLAIGHRLSNFVHIARDLIDHQHALRIETMPYFFPRLFKTTPSRPRRTKVQQRLKRVIAEMVKDGELCEVIFAAHSQGSVIAFDYIRDHAGGEGELGAARVQFVSFGSPLGHIYQKYFHEYRPGGEDWLMVATRVDQWINLYRVDDPIGGEIELPEGGDITNEALPAPGGHMNYWNDRKLAESLHTLIQSAAQSQGGWELPPDPPREMPLLWPPAPRAM